MLDLARLDEVGDRAGDVLYRHIGIDAMLIEQIDAVGAQAFQGRFGDGADVFRSAVHAFIDVAFAEAELGGQDDVIAERLHSLAQQVFVGALGIGFGGVEKGDAAIKRCADQGDGVRAFGGRAIAEAQAHTAEAERRDSEAVAAENTFLHIENPYSVTGAR